MTSAPLTKKGTEGVKREKGTMAKQTATGKKAEEWTESRGARCKKILLLGTEVG